MRNDHWLCVHKITLRFCTYVPNDKCVHGPFCAWITYCSTWMGMLLPHAQSRAMTPPCSVEAMPSFLSLRGGQWIPSPRSEEGNGSPLLSGGQCLPSPHSKGQWLPLAQWRAMPPFPSLRGGQWLPSAQWKAMPPFPSLYEQWLPLAQRRAMTLPCSVEGNAFFPSLRGGQCLPSPCSVEGNASLPLAQRRALTPTPCSEEDNDSPLLSGGQCLLPLA